MKRILLLLTGLFVLTCSAIAQQRRPIDNEHPLWMIHIDVWNAADPQKIIDLVPDDIKPWVCMNLSVSCQYDKEKNVYKMPRSAVRTYKSWATVCQQNGLWFTCQPASGGRTHLQADDLETFEYFFKRYPNFLGWNFAEQFWGFDESDKGSVKQVDQIALFANLVKMSHQYGGFLTISFCGNIWSYGLSPVGMMKRNRNLLQACRDYPEAILWLYKYTTSGCWYNNESVTLSPFISGLAKNYGVRYDRCGWCGAMDAILGQNKAKYPIAAGIGTVMEQCGVNGGAVWDGPETIPDECFKETNKSTVDGYTRRNWTTYEGFRGAWIDMWRKVIDGTFYIPSRKEVVDSTRIALIANSTSGNDEDKYATWGTLYDGLYKQDDPANVGNGQLMDNHCYFKGTGRYRTIPLCVELYDDLANTIPVKLNRTTAKSNWNTVAKKQNVFNAQYPKLSEGDLFVSRVQNQLVTYMPYTYLNSKRTATGRVPLLYNTCESLTLTLGMLGSGIVREYRDHIDIYLNNFRTDTTTTVTETIMVKGATSEPSYTMKKGLLASASANAQWNAGTGTYTLNVVHKGGVDITINCAGNATSNVINNVPVATALPTPKQPTGYHGPIIIEAENMDYKNVKDIKLVNPYWDYFPDIVEFAGNGFVDMGTNTGGTLRHQLTLNDGEQGEYRISVRYTSTTKSGVMRATVNGVSTQLNIEKTDMNDWHKVTFNATLKAGSNNLLLTNTGALPMYIDQIIYTPADMEAERYLIAVRDVANGTVTPNVTEAAEGDIVSLNVNAANGYQLKELRVTNGVYYTLDKTIKFSGLNSQNSTITFTMPDDQVVLKPVFGIATNTTDIYKLDLTSTSEGTLPPGWRCVQENGEVHEYPANYSLGARIFSGFTGYQGTALYWRDNCAEYGRQSAYPLTLSAGDYKLSFATAAWKESPQYKVKILDANDAVVAESSTYTATPNANGDKSSNVTSTQNGELNFTVTKAGNYIIRFEDVSTFNGYHEFLLLDCVVASVERQTSIRVVSEDGSMSDTIYDLHGRRYNGNNTLSPGIYIKNGKKILLK